MSPDHEPDWGLLPRDPAGFFGLPPKFDLRELKSRYAEFVRRYKPEKAPDEFRRIRAAFEALKERLSSGSRPLLPPLPFDLLPFEFDAEPTAPEVRSDGEPSPEQTDGDCDSERPSTSEPNPDHGHTDEDEPHDPPISEERLRRQLREIWKFGGPRRNPESDSTEALFEKYWRKQRKSPRDYYALAILSDFAEHDSLGFGGWLLVGVQQYPKDRGLLVLLQAYFETERAAAEAAALLVAASRSVPGDKFYFLTQPLWDRLLDAGEFEVLCELLNECEANLPDHDGMGRWKLRLEVLRRGVWIADDDWLERIAAEVEFGEYGSTPSAAKVLDRFEHLLVYRSIRPRFVDGSRLREELDSVLVESTMGDVAGTNDKVIECHRRLVERVPELFEDFPVGLFGLEPFLVPWEFVAHDAWKRPEGPHREITGEQTERIRLLAQDLMSATVWRVARLLLFAPRIGRVIVKLLILLLMAWIALIGIAGLFVAPTVPPAAVIIEVCVAGLLYWLWRLLRLIPNKANARPTSLHNRCYGWVWRRRILDFLRTDPIPVRRLADELSLLEGQKVNGHRIRGTEQIAELLAHDIGLALFQIAQSFVSARERDG